MHNTAALPVIKNTHSLPYCDLDDNDALMIGDLPMVLKPSEYKSDDKVPCCICKQDLKISKMRNHVGYHILCKLCTHPDPIFQDIGLIPCGFCGLDDCNTYLALVSDKASITSDCPYHHTRMIYKAANISSNATSSTNIHIHCPLCEADSAGSPVTIWKYNAIQHILTEHPDPDNSDQHKTISPEFWIKIMIRKAEEKPWEFRRREQETTGTGMRFQTVRISYQRRNQVKVVCSRRE